ncbi:MAG: M24 family metallopeptidase [Dehalococcoidia bacterium]
MDPLKYLMENPTPSEMAFPESEYRERVAKVRKGMEQVGIEVLLVTHLPNLYYLAGYHTIIPNRYGCLILPLEGEPSIHIADVELGAVFAMGWVRDVEIYHYYDAAKAMDLLVGMLKERGHETRQIGVETGISGLHVNQYHRLRELLPNARLVDASKVVYEVRKVKSPAEIQCIRKAGEITVKGVKAAINAIAPGKTDNDLAAVAHETMIRAGSEYFTKWQNIMTGHRSGFHHSFHARVPLKVGDHIYLELGASYKRYDALMMRTAFLGQPDDLTRRMSDAMLTTFDLLTENIRPGRTCHDVAMAARNGVGSVASEAFFIENFGYSVGIGVPSIWGEDLIFIAEGVHEPLQKGMVFHTPMTIHVPGKCGVGFSETIVVTDTGCESLTAKERELAVVPA